MVGPEGGSDTPVRGIRRARLAAPEAVGVQRYASTGLLELVRLSVPCPKTRHQMAVADMAGLTRPRPRSGRLQGSAIGIRE